MIFENKTSRKMPLSRLALAGIAVLGAVVVAGESFAQTRTTVSYGRITNVQQVDLRNQGARNAGTLVGGLAGVATGSGQSSSNRALRGIAGGTVGRRVGAAAGSSTGFEYTVLVGTETVRIRTENSGLRVNDCVSVERGSFNNIRLAPDERCDRAASVPRDATSAASACIAAKDQVMNASTDAEFERAERRMRLVCD